ncbi:UNVERIFIED_CONTAM: protein COFACTOR ASSEMBLY OF COMPLEX C SUBUNIT B CCB2, chloroplastic [Sesamum calycinum]|uniref:Protein COFACTOR ASSEMBLY OF COMPLEX C SUBUNIT B CCB2, chloroplastic n=1 Tax=Sesamum calycinum TaxID=2727403 RepID=A0AAW2QUJ1_9LAMI
MLFLFCSFSLCSSQFGVLFPLSPTGGSKNEQWHCRPPLSPLIPLTSRAKFNFPAKFTINKPPSLAKICCSQNTTPNSNSSTSQFFASLLRTEVLGLSLAAFSAVVPYLGKFLKGASPRDQKSLPEGAEQIFIMSQDIADNMKEDLAWGTYVLLRNTNSISVLISVQDALCVRGYWNTPKDLSKENTPDWFGKQIKKIGFSNLKDTMYFQQAADSELKEMVIEGTRSLLVQPIMRAPSLSSSQTKKSKGFVSITHILIKTRHG